MRGNDSLVKTFELMHRTRRLRKSEGIRRLVKETRLSIDDFVYPLFIEEGENIETNVSTARPRPKLKNLPTPMKDNAKKDHIDKKNLASQL